MPIKNIYSGGMVIGDTYHRGGTISIVPYRMRSDTFNHKGFVFDRSTRETAFLMNKEFSSISSAC
ncbi:hypothetical protein, partial [uncultured Ruminobacter sp.]|uniref:hypothetical protein n=1 Tax=uncultured Ruminobacter sp. TaxID=538947 RepID=UPI002623306F